MAEKAPQTSLHTVLVVENDVLVRLSISAYLRDCGYRTIEAASDDEAMIVLTSSQLVIDVVLTDAGLGGGGGGFSLSQWVRSNKPEAGVILVGGPAAAAEAAAELCDKGPMLSRPYEPQAVVDQIRQLLAARKPPG